MILLPYKKINKKTDFWRSQSFFLQYIKTRKTNTYCTAKGSITFGNIQPKSEIDTK